MSKGKTDDRLLSLRRAVISLSVYFEKVDWSQPYNKDVKTERSGGTAFVLNEFPSVPTGFLALTAYHVVHNAVRIRATLFENDEDHPSAPIEARLMLYSVDLDTAVIHIDAPRPKWLASLVMGDSSQLLPNVQIKVAGFPLREDFQVTTGFVSGRLPDRVQVDASVNPGNSGGPLISVEDGSVLGVVVSGFSPEKAQNVNFCTPIEDVRLVLLPTLMKRPKGSKEIQSIPMSSFNFNLISTSPDFLKLQSGGSCAAGALVARVNEESSGYGTGLRVDDIVCSLDGHKIGYKATVRVPWWKVDAISYTTILARKPVGSEVAIEFYSREKARMIKSKLKIERNMDRFRNVDVQSESIPYQRLGGVVVQPLSINLFNETPVLQKRFGYVLQRPDLQQRSLLIVTHIDADSPFTVMNQLTANDAIVGVNGTSFDGGDVEHYASAFKAAMGTGMVLLRLYTGKVASATAKDIRAWQEKASVSP
jgi:S1-C subfamily serine protease